MAGKTLYDKLWDSHLVKQRDDGSALIYIDRHIIHEVTSPQAFEGLRLAGRKPWRIDANIATRTTTYRPRQNARAASRPLPTRSRVCRFRPSMTTVMSTASSSSR